MKLEIAKLWAEALLSGKYKQGTGYLCQKDNNTGKESHCCLGVLCEVAPDTSKNFLHGNAAAMFGDGEDANEGVLPDAVQEWAGMKSGGGVLDAIKDLACFDDIDENDRPYRLWQLNDQYDWSFDDLAELILEHSEDL